MANDAEMQYFIQTVSQKFNGDPECYKQIVILVSIQDQKISVNNTELISDAFPDFKQKRYIDGVKKISAEILNRYKIGTFLNKYNNPYIQNATEWQENENTLSLGIWIIISISIILIILTCFCCYFCKTLRNNIFPCCSKVGLQKYREKIY
jgi:hypothetical protein